MYNELTEVDIKKMQEEIDYKTRVVRPKCIEDLKTARGFGDLSENYEYKAAKQRMRATASSYGSPYATSNQAGGCSGSDVCTSLICADCLCECCGGDLIRCC